MLDQVLSWGVIFLPLAISIIFIFVPARQEDERQRMKWRLWLVVFGVLFGALSWWQQSRALRNARKDQEEAIQRTVEMVSQKVVPRVAAETSGKVTDILNTQYGAVIGGLYKELGEQNAARKNELALNYAPSIDLIYAGEQLQVWNRGRTNIKLWGDKYDGETPDLGGPPFVISPATNRYLLTDRLRAAIQAKLGQNGEARVPFDVYISTADGQKYVMHGELWEIIKDGQITIHTQNHGFEKKDWSQRP
ncbi:MAG: hypothetical protein WAN12_09255 [Candidatus Acidiferrum sp.]